MLTSTTKRNTWRVWSGMLASLAVVAFAGAARADDSMAKLREARESLRRMQDDPSIPKSPTGVPQGAVDPVAGRVIDDDDPESAVLTPEEAMKNPLNMGYLLMALADRADGAAAKGDHAREAKYYRAIAKAVPDRSVGYRRACAAHDAAGEWEKATDMCRGALATGGVTVEDHMAFLKVLLKKADALTESEIADADAVIQRCEGELKLGEKEEGRKLIADSKCQLAAKLEDTDRLTACITALRAAKAEPAKFYVYRWALSLSEGDATGARHVIDQAKKAGLPPKAIEGMERGMSKADTAPTARFLQMLLRRWWPVLLCATLSLLALYAGLKVRRARPQAA